MVGSWCDLFITAAVMSWPIMLFVTDYRIANSNQKLKDVKDVTLKNESSNPI